MLKLKNKAERAAYRKIKKETGHERYLENLLCKNDSQKWEKLDKSLSAHDMKYLDSDEREKQSDIRKQTGDRLEKISKVDLSKEEDSKNKYSEMYFQKTQERESNLKVERERLNIEREVYYDTIKKSEKNLHDVIKKFQEISTKLEEKYVLGHELFMEMGMYKDMKRKSQLAKNSVLNLNEFEEIENLEGIQSLSESINVSKIEIVDENTREIKRLTKMIHDLKKEQRLLEKKEKDCAAEVKLELKLRNEFIYGIVRNGYYQENGMKWIFEQMVEMSLKDEINKEEIFKNRSEGQYSEERALKNPLLNLDTMRLKEEHMPEFLDARSRRYLLFVYQEITNINKNNIRIDLKRGLDSELRVRNFSNSSLNNSKIIVDESGVLGDINGGESNEISRSQSKEKQNLRNGSNKDDRYSGEKRYQSVLNRMSNINHKSNMDVHNNKEKFNFHIKDIYQNTAESIKTWIKHKCKVIDGSRYGGYKELEREQSESRLEKRVSFSMKRVQVEIPIKVSRSSQKLEKQERNVIKFEKEKEKKSFELSNKMESYLIGDINIPSGCSLPLIKNKKGKIMPNNMSSMMRRQASETSQKSKSILSKCGKQMENPEMREETVEELEKYEKVRVMRTYPKNEQERAFKVLFGITSKL